MAKKPKNKKATAKKAKPAKKPAKKKVSSKPAKSLSKKTKLPAKKKDNKPAKKAAKQLSNKKLKVDKLIKKDSKSINLKPIKAEKPLKQQEKIVAPAAPAAKPGRPQGKPAKVPKEKEKKIIKAPLIIPNQRIGEKELVTVSKKAEPKGKYELEFVVRSSPAVLFELLSTPSGLSEWFADDVNIRDDVFTFFWDGSAQSAKVIGLREAEFIRFQWVDKKDGSYFEFRLQIDELTGDVSLIITDFADNDSEKESSRLLWESQVNKMLHVLGSYF